jgi:hypothetical protein
MSGLLVLRLVGMRERHRCQLRIRERRPLWRVAGVGEPAGVGERTGVRAEQRLGQRVGRLVRGRQHRQQQQHRQQRGGGLAQGVGSTVGGLRL